MEEILQLKITLSNTKPAIYRQVLVRKATTFFEFHNIIQITMGWENSHLFEFYVNNYRIGLPEYGFQIETPGDENNILDAMTITLESIIIEENEEFEYEYDFGDSWKHLIVVEKILPLNERAKYPICLSGEYKCPPEDCGGLGGFYELLQIIKNKKHPEYKEMMTWLGNKFDPEFFDMKDVNKRLSALDSYIQKWLNGED